MYYCSGREFKLLHFELVEVNHQEKITRLLDKTANYEEDTKGLSQRGFFFQAWQPKLCYSYSVKDNVNHQQSN